MTPPSAAFADNFKIQGVVPERTAETFDRHLGMCPSSLAAPRQAGIPTPIRRAAYQCRFLRDRDEVARETMPPLRGDSQRRQGLSAVNRAASEGRHRLDSISNWPSDDRTCRKSFQRAAYPHTRVHRAFGKEAIGAAPPGFGVQTSPDRATLSS